MKIDGCDGDETTEKRTVNQSTAVEDKVKSMTVCMLAAVVYSLSKPLSSVHVSSDCSDKAPYCYYTGTTMQE